MAQGKDENRTSGVNYGKSKGLFGVTDRESGEYCFKSGYTQQVYSNAHYVPADESTMPPQYYRPDIKNTTKKQKKSDRKRTGVPALIILCLACAILGGAAGAYLMASYFYVSPAAVNENRQETAAEYQAEEDTARETAVISAEPAAEVYKEEVLSPAEIYSAACGQVTGITTEIVTVDRYGNQIPSSISGSGFFVSTDGYILTNYHVVETAYANGINVAVTMFDGTVYPGRIAGVDADNDIALVKIEKNGNQTADFGDSSEMEVGDEIYTVGNPYGVLEFTMTTGHISALDRLIATDENRQASGMFQIDAAVYSGNSGGPVYNSHGEVVGVVTARYAETGMEGIGFAIPINDVLQAVSSITGKTAFSGRAEIGAGFDDRYNTVYSRYYNLPEGAFVENIISGSCADRAGLKPGDILMQLGEYGIYGFNDVIPALRHFTAGDNTQAVVFREGQVLSVQLTLD